MKTDLYDVLVIGAGPAGIAAAVRCKDFGLDVLLIESKEKIGGIPLQCTHPGFGNFYHQENMTGTEFAESLIQRTEDIGIMTEAHVTSIKNVSEGENQVDVITPDGIFTLNSRTIIYTTGARERHRFETGIQGDRLSGVYTAGETQTLMDIYGVMPGKEVVIIGSGDIGLIMARRFALEGAEVKAVMEMLPYPGGLTRNVVQCLHDFDIPLLTKKMVKKIKGEKRVKEVITMNVDHELEPIPGTQGSISCDTVALATGLIPYTKKLKELGTAIDPSTKGPIVNEYFETSLPGIFAAGNVVAINDYVDYAAFQGVKAAEGVFRYIEEGGVTTGDLINVRKGRNIRLIVPQRITGKDGVTLYCRVKKPEPDVDILVKETGEKIESTSVNPGEMIRLKLQKEKLKGIEDEMTIEVVT